VTERVKEKAEAVAERVRERAHEVRENVPSARQVKERSVDWYSRNIENQPMLFALGAVLCGLVCAALLPVSQPERRIIEPAKRKAQESLQGLSEKIEEKLSASEAKTEGDGHHEQVGFQAESATNPLKPT
jgi:hypothetical protein